MTTTLPASIFRSSANAALICGSPVVVENTKEVLANSLVQIGTSKDEKAFCLIYEHFAGRIKSFLVGKGTDEDTAEELMQEIMLTVWRKSDTYNPARAAASTWIFTIARNRRIDYLRGNHRVEVELDDVLLEHEKESGNVARTLDEELGIQQHSDRLYDALEELPREQKQVMHLSYFRGQSHGDIATWLGLPVGTVKSRIRLALQSIKTSMPGDEGGEPSNAGGN